jgi:hypothetical protein
MVFKKKEATAEKAAPLRGIYLTRAQYRKLLEKSAALVAIGEEPYVRLAHHIIHDRVTRAVALGRDLSEELLAVKPYAFDIEEEEAVKEAALEQATKETQEMLANLTDARPIE